MPDIGPEDPFAHLHEEDFETPFMSPLLTDAGMIFMGDRVTESLAGDWRFVLDPFREGLRQRWFEHDATPIEEWTVPRDCDDAAWQTIPVPGCWNLARAEWRYYEGAAWYMRDLDVAPPRDGERLFLRIGAATGRARVFLNGRFLGLHRGGWTPFFVEIGPYLREAGNLLMCEVDTTRRDDAVPMSHFDWFNYGGLFREVELVRVPAIHVTDFRLWLIQGDRIAARVVLSNPTDGEAEIEIDGLGTGRVAISAGEGETTFDLSPRLWSPSDPHLYQVRLRFGADRVGDRVGFRRIERHGTEIRLNGEPVAFRGICAHEDDRDLGRCTSEADIRRRFGHAKELGANAMRLAHYPHSELAAKIADEVGILLWEEIPVYWAIAFENPETFAEAENQLREMIRRDFNRASVVLWGIGNENADTDARLRFMSGLAATARREDPDRLVGAACLINRVAFRIEDRLAEALDVIGLNEYFGWYEPGFDGLRRLLANSAPDRPVMVTETGADARVGLHGSDMQLFTEEYQARVLATQVEIADGADYVAGIFPWLLYDFRSERRQTRHQRGWNLKGVIAADKTTRKLGFEALRAAYATHFRKGDS
ncbi:glycoside hydrolase family 2 protein [Tropicimonas sp. IMCC6043]|uniref:glycoside hydrolase family 2 protein n=1 Tax=Tropicimonas sp. IMCC6043 TaxID=2510645 RepID=UPI00101C3E90|nr:glycoside hydrolase family 2 TIM barrel-domain containing protein [Tropicimonas sp. IMCC6043]RYH07352.1 glycoside hydrolase family 2 [Tropicimonas sp. IMCC6043]